MVYRVHFPGLFGFESDIAILRPSNLLNESSFSKKIIYYPH